MKSSFNSLFFKHLLLINKEGTSLLILGFYLLIVIISPFASNIINANALLNSNIIWISLLFSIILTIENIFNKDFEDGSFDLLYLTKVPLELIILSKSFIHWATIGFPLIVITPILYKIFNIYFDYYLLISLCLSTFNMINLTVICASLTVTIKQRGILLALITLPLSIPTLIFSFSISSFIFLFLNLIIVLSVTPLISSFILRLSFE